MVQRGRFVDGAARFGWPARRTIYAPGRANTRQLAIERIDNFIEESVRLILYV